MSDQQTGRRDKFASLKATQAQATQAAQATEAQATEVKPVKRDKFASLAAKQGMSSNQPEESKPTITKTSARRDKFASLAATQKEQSTHAETKVPNKPKRDKFASMAQRNAKPKRDKFASMRQTQHDKSTGLSQDSDQKKKIDSTSELVLTSERLKKRINQRQKIFRDLEKAEGHTWNLILLAGETARNLTNLKVEESNNDLSELSKKYRDTLQNIHSLLCPHADFVKAYQNHQEEEETKNMYAARVETRLSQEKRNVIQEFLRLEKQNEDNGASNHKKRKLEG
mmetsp:Transcript_13893/g.20506  ORF Transcript_13893/g.20506 Transcript_13893/m.20506 type:complete len:284 (+) Transcript_13893:60-911(+)